MLEKLLTTKLSLSYQTGLVKLCGESMEDWNCEYEHTMGIDSIALVSCGVFAS